MYLYKYIIDYRLLIYNLCTICSHDTWKADHVGQPISRPGWVAFYSHGGFRLRRASWSWIIQAPADHLEVHGWTSKFGLRWDDSETALRQLFPDVFVRKITAGIWSELYVCGQTAGNQAYIFMTCHSNSSKRKMGRFVEGPDSCRWNIKDSGILIVEWAMGCTYTWYPQPFKTLPGGTSRLIGRRKPWRRKIHPSCRWIRNWRCGNSTAMILEPVMLFCKSPC